MEDSKIDARWPNALRWFLKQDLHRFTPWHLLQDPADFEFAARAFDREDVSNGHVFVFARRQDRDDFAGIEVIDGKFTDKVLYFHPVFSTGASGSRTWNIVNSVYEDVFAFMSGQVIPDMKEWAEDEDAADL
jgi:hypothetical protein